MFRRHPVLAVITFIYLGVVGWVTLGPQPLDSSGNALLFRLLAEFAQHPSTNWITYQRVEFLANVAMFIPIGIFFLLLFGRWWWFASVFAGVMLTCVIEFAQMFIPSRVSDVSDLIANSTGTFVGVLFALIVTTPAALRDRREKREAAVRADQRTRVAA